ncbi:restriction endonuclease [Streptomyces sp. NPDC059564]|uniref:restriction endonuclease n=1 Tax=Streptomyces sp. NPDC059564 TaxID=3346865 RepID=UPI0036A2F64E
MGEGKAPSSSRERPPRVRRSADGRPGTLPGLPTARFRSTWSSTTSSKLLRSASRRRAGRQQCKRYAAHRTVGSPDLRKLNGTVRDEHGADVPLFVASCKVTKQARASAARRS